MHTPSPIPQEYQPQANYSSRHVHFAQSQSRRPFQRDQRNENASIRKRLSRSCDHLSDHNFSPRLPPIRRKPTKHVPSTLSLVIHGTLFLVLLFFLDFWFIFLWTLFSVYLYASGARTLSEVDLPLKRQPQHCIPRRWD